MLKLVEAPVPFVTLEDAKKHVQVVHTRDDEMITDQITSAIEFLDGPKGYLGAAIAPQKWLWKSGAFTDPMRFPLGPVVSIDSVSYIDGEGATVSLDLASVYLFGDSESPYLRPVSDFPTDVSCRDDAVSIEFTAGRAVIPAQLKSAVLLIVGQLYRFREIDVDFKHFPVGFSMFDLAHPYRAVI